MRIKKASEIMLLTLSLAVAACGHDNPSERELASGRPGGEVHTPSGSGQRPGVGEANSMDKELADGVWRIVGSGISLRYDRGGVLLTTEADGTIRVIDLDGADSVTVNIGEEGCDSVMTGAEMTVNGQPLDLGSMKMLSHGDGRSWYVATETSGTRWIIVVP